MKKISLLLGIALISLAVVSCGSSKETAQQKPVPQNQPKNMPCPDCVATPGGTFKYLGQTVAESEYDVQNARIFAAQSARDELQAMIESVVERAVKSFSQQHRENSESTAIEKRTIQALDVIKAKVKNTPVTCWDAAPSKLTPGKISVYVCVEMDANSVYNEVVETFAADKEIKIDFKEHQFKEEFDKAMEDYEGIR
ncbi:MAG: hypothetical protein J6X10_01620 [Bacteroidales bacterium]|nr:hypothetical protein [Bacteroidales bacterium]